MAEEKRKVAVVIGVGQAKPLKYLSGAVNGARDFSQWAQALGYEVKLISDEPDAKTGKATSVTMNRLRTELEQVLLRADAPPIHRLILYFAGHGLVREADEG